MSRFTVWLHSVLPYVAVLVAMLLWGTSTIGTKLALETFPPITLITLRFTIAVVVLFLVGSLSGKLQRLRLRDLPLFMLAGFIQPFGYYMFETFGLEQIATPTVAEVILSTIPLFSPVFAWLLLRERANRYNLLGILISMIGVLIMILAGGTTFTSSPAVSYVLLGCAVVSSILYAIMLRKIPAQYNDISIVFYIFAFGTLLFYPVFFLVDYPTLNVSDLAWDGFWSICYLAVVCSVVCYILFCYCVRRIGVTRTNVFNNIRPVFTALYMLFFFAERLPMIKWVGILIVVAGLFVSQYTPRKG